MTRQGIKCGEWWHSPLFCHLIASFGFASQAYYSAHTQQLSRSLHPAFDQSLADQQSDKVGAGNDATELIFLVQNQYCTALILK